MFTWARFGSALRGLYGRSEEQAALFAAHDERGAKVTPIDEIQLVRYHAPRDQQRVKPAIRLSYEFEWLFYMTVMAVILSEV